MTRASIAHERSVEYRRARVLTWAGHGWAVRLVEPSLALTIHVDLESMRIASFGPVHVVCYFATPTVQGLRTSHACHRKLIAHEKVPTSVLSIVDGTFALPDSEVRELGSSLFKEVATSMRCSANVVLGSGFRVAALRSVLAGIYLVSRSPCPTKAFADIASAAHWVADMHDGAIDARALATAVARAYPLAGGAQG
jgi:hypothetical protein